LGGIFHAQGKKSIAIFGTQQCLARHIEDFIPSIHSGEIVIPENKLRLRRLTKCTEYDAGCISCCVVKQGAFCLSSLSRPQIASLRKQWFRKQALRRFRKWMIRAGTMKNQSVILLRKTERHAFAIESLISLSYDAQPLIRCFLSCGLHDTSMCQHLLEIRSFIWCRDERYPLLFNDQFAKSLDKLGSFTFRENTDVRFRLVCVSFFS